MTRAEAHLACLALVCCDALARSLRLHCLLHGMGVRARFAASLLSTGVGDLAAALSPMRLLGVPAQAAALARGGVPVPATAAALGVDALVGYPVIALCGAALATAFGGAWLSDVGSRLAAAADEFAPALAVVGAACVLAVWGARRLRRRLAARSPVVARGANGSARLLPRVVRGIRSAVASARATRPWAVGASVPLSVVSVAGRTLVLPVLIHTLPAPGELGVTLLGSFVLLYGQLAIPTPSGVGVVELAAVAGAAGALGADVTWVLVWWRLYTGGASLLLVAPLALRTRWHRALSA